MGNQQAFRVYISCECNKRLYIGYTSKPVDSPYLGSFSDKTFKPLHKFNIHFSSVVLVSRLMEWGYQNVRKGLEGLWDRPGYRIKQQLAVLRKNIEKVRDYIENDVPLKSLKKKYRIKTRNDAEIVLQRLFREEVELKTQLETLNNQ